MSDSSERAGGCVTAMTGLVAVCDSSDRAGGCVTAVTGLVAV